MISATAWSRGILLLAAAAWIATQMAAAVPKRPAPGGKDADGFIPTGPAPALPGKTVGVLVSDAQGVMALSGRGGPADALCFSHNGGAYGWVYVAVKDKPLIGALELPVGQKGDKKQRFDNLSMANPATVKKWGVAEPYALVEVEVNGGLGCPAGESFVATSIKVLDGSAEYPLQVAKAIEDLRNRYRSYLKEQQKSIEAAMSQAAKNALKERAPTGPRETSEVLYVTWLPETKQLRVHFRTMITDGAYSYGRGIEPLADGAIPGPARPPRDRGVRFGTMFGVELGMAYEVSRTGAVERTEGGRCAHSGKRFRRPFEK
jgi:hypothetical protein